MQQLLSAQWQTEYRLVVIDHHRKIIFLHIGKTAGTAVEYLLFGKYPERDRGDRLELSGPDEEEGIYLQHATAATVRRLAGSDVFDAYFKFSVVRNPYRRLLSVYYYAQEYHLKNYGGFNGLIKALPRLLKDERVQRGSHYLPQTAYTHLDGELVCDYVAKFEDLPDSLEMIRERYAIKAPLFKINETQGLDWSKKSVVDDYDDESVAIMQEIYADDFRCHGYSIDPAEA